MTFSKREYNQSCQLKETSHSPGDEKPWMLQCLITHDGEATMSAFLLTAWKFALLLRFHIGVAQGHSYLPALGSTRSDQVDQKN